MGSSACPSLIGIGKNDDAFASYPRRTFARQILAHRKHEA